MFFARSSRCLEMCCGALCCSVVECEGVLGSRCMCFDSLYVASGAFGRHAVAYVDKQKQS